MTAVVDRPGASEPDVDAPPAEEAAAADRAERSRRRRRQFTGQALLAPTTLWLAVFLLVPLGFIVAYALFGERNFGLGGADITGFTTENIRTALSGDYLAAFVRSLWFALLTALVTLLLGYPLAWLISRHGGRWQTWLLILVMIPFWTSYLARMFAWRSLLSTEGFLNTALGWTGLVDPADAPQWLGSPFAVVLVLVYSFLPFMILPLYISIDRLDYRLVEASYDLGAGRIATFFRVIVRQTLPGILGGTLLVFVPCVGDFATAQIIGGNTQQTRMVGQQIEGLFGRQNNFPLGSSLALLLMVFIVVGMIVYVRSIGRDEGGF